MLNFIFGIIMGIVFGAGFIIWQMDSIFDHLDDFREDLERQNDDILELFEMQGKGESK